MRIPFSRSRLNQGADTGVQGIFQYLVRLSVPPLQEVDPQLRSKAITGLRLPRYPSGSTAQWPTATLPWNDVLHIGTKRYRFVTRFCPHFPFVQSPYTCFIVARSFPEFPSTTSSGFVNDRWAIQFSAS